MRVAWYWQVLVSVLASAGAGIGTGFAGLSAAVFIVPALVAFLGMEAYDAVGIALAADVLASAVSAFDYHKKGNIDIKNGKYLLVSVLIFTIVGSFVGSIVPHRAMGFVTIVGPLLLGVKFLFFPGKETKSARVKSARRKIIESLICGVYIGFVCGFMGTGGGMMMLLVLNVILGYELKCAVGTSVFVMTFSALFGAVSHFWIGGMHWETTSGREINRWLILGVCIVATLIFAHISAKIANHTKHKWLNLITGLLLTVSSAIMLICHWLNITTV